MLRYLFDHPELIIAGYLFFLAAALRWFYVAVYKDPEDLPLYEELEHLEEQLEPAFQFPPKWQDETSVELPRRDRIGLRSVS